MDSSAHYQKRIAELRSKVSKYDNTRSYSTFNFRYQQVILNKYFLASIATLIVLVSFRPRFIYNIEHKADGDISTFSFQKLVISWVIISGVLAISIYAYQKKEE